MYNPFRRLRVQLSWNRACAVGVVPGAVMVKLRKGGGIGPTLALVTVVSISATYLAMVSPKYEV